MLVRIVVVATLAAALAGGCRGTRSAETLEAPADEHRIIERLEPADGPTNPNGTLSYEVIVREGERVETWYVTMRSGPFQFTRAWSVPLDLPPAADGAQRPDELKADVQTAKVLVRRPGRPEVSSWMNVPLFPPTAGLFFLPLSGDAYEVARNGGALDADGVLASLGPAALLLSWSQNEALEPLLGELVGRPPVRFYLKALFSGEVSMSLDRPRSIGAGTFLLGANGLVPTARIAQEIQVFGEPLMDLVLEAVEPSPPLNLTLGLVRLTGRSRTDPDRSIEVRLIGALKDGGEPLGSGTVTIPVPRKR